MLYRIASSLVILTLCTGARTAANDYGQVQSHREYVARFTTRIDTGIFSHDVFVTNNESIDLYDGRLTIQVRYLDGTRGEFGQNFDKWHSGESLKFNLTVKPIALIQLSGICLDPKTFDKVSRRESGKPLDSELTSIRNYSAYDAKMGRIDLKGFTRRIDKGYLSHDILLSHPYKDNITNVKGLLLIETTDGRFIFDVLAKKRWESGEELKVNIPAVKIRSILVVGTCNFPDGATYAIDALWDATE